MKKAILIFVMTVIVLTGSPLNAQEKMVFSTFPEAGLVMVYKKVLTQAYERIGISIEIKHYPGERALDMSNSGKADGEAARLTAIEKNYTNLIRVPVPLYILKLVGFSKQDIPVAGYESLKPYKLATLRGYKQVEGQIQKMNYIALPSFEQVLQMVDAGRVDIGITSLLDGLKVIKTLKLKGIKVLDPPFHEAPLYHYLHKKHENFVPKISASLQEMEKEGIIQKIGDEVVAELKVH
jgi:polar amino acid transport system substrate-binding protein